MAGISDVRHELCFALALWNGADPIVKERMFGLTGPQGNHGEDVKEYWWYLDALPSHAWLRWRYHYPQSTFPYQQLIDENARRSRDDPEFELLDTGVFDDDRYWVVEVCYAKASPTEVLARITVQNQGPEEATLSVLPTVWFRNTWRISGDEPPTLRLDMDSIVVDHARLVRLSAGCHRDRGRTRRRPRCSVTTRPTRNGCSGSNRDHRVPEGRDQRPRRRRCGDGESRPARHQGVLVVPAHRSRRWPSRGPAPPTPPPESAVANDWSGRYFDDRDGRPGTRRRRVLCGHRAGRHRSRADASAAPGVRRPGLEQTDLPLSGEAVARRRPGSAGSAARVTPRVATPAGDTSIPSTCWRCPIPGSTPGSRPGTWPSTRSRGPTSIRPSPSTSCWCCCGSGSNTPTARCRRTSGTSTTSTRRSTPWPRSGCS